MNILHIVPSFIPCYSAGGVVNAAYQIAKNQSKHGHNVTVYTTDNCKKRLKQKNGKIDGINVHYFKNISNTFKNLAVIDTPLFFNKHLRKNIKKFDIIHIHEHRHTLAILTHRQAIKNNIPYVLQAHGSVLPFFQKEKLKEIFDKLWGNKILKDAKNVLALTEIEKEQYLKMNIEEDKIKIVPIGVDLKEYENLPPEGKFREKYNINENNQILLFIGRIHKIKGLDLLIKALNHIDNENITTCIVGEDYGFKKEVEKLIKEYNLEKSVIFTGPLTGRDKLEALVDCNIFIMPSRYESFTTSGLEAMACEKPIILTDKNHIESWVRDDCGLICEFNEKSLKECIETLIEVNDLKEYFGKKGKKLIEKKYNWDDITKELEKIYTCHD